MHADVSNDILEVGGPRKGNYKVVKQKEHTLIPQENLKITLVNNCLRSGG